MFSYSPAPHIDRVSALTHFRLRQCIGACATVVLFAALGMDVGLSPYALVFCGTWLAFTTAQYELAARRKLQPRHNRAIFASLLLDVVFLGCLIGFIGGTHWCGPILYVYPTVASITTLSARRAVIIGGVALVTLALVLSLQAGGIVPSSTFLGAVSTKGAWSNVVAMLVLTTLTILGLAWTQFNLVFMLRQRSMRYRAMMDTASDIIAIVAHDGRVKNVNRATLVMAQASRKDVLRDGLSRLLVDEDVALFRTKLTRALAGEQQIIMLRAKAYHGIRWLSCTLAPMSPGVRTTDLLAIFRDVTDDRLAADTIRSSEARLRAVFDQAAIAIALLDADGCFAEVNPAVERLLGYDDAGLIGRAWNTFAPPEDLEGTTTTIRALQAQERDHVTIEQRFVRADGRVIWALLTISRVDNPTGAAGLIAMLQDITERRALESQLTWQAYHDSLTNLANRALFRERVDEALASRSQETGSVAVLFLDLDNFKTINDSMGHSAGDQLLFEVGRRLQNATRGCDTVARLGGDEFAILIDKVRGPEDCVRVADRILQSMQVPVTLDGIDVTVGTSIGIVRDTGDETADDMLRNADVAMYNAKQGGKGRHSLFEPGMHDKAVERMRLETDLRAAIENDEILIAYQPIVTLADGKPYGFEALARWTHPTFGIVPPSTFIPLAEETGLIVALGCTILRRACQQASEWNAFPGLRAPIGITVNVSGRQLEETALLAHVRDALAAAALDASLLTLEITETALVHNSETMRERLHQLKAIGVSLAIDDFGTGYSSLSYIQQFPVDVLKIDRSFVEGLKRSNGTDAALARTIIALGASLQIRTIAEGIEVDAQRAILRELGCESGQGYLYARPMPAADAREWLATTLGLTLPQAGAIVQPPRGERRRPTREVALVSER